MRCSWLLLLGTVTIVLQAEAFGDFLDDHGDSDGDDDVSSLEINEDPCNYDKFAHIQPVSSKIGKRVSNIKCEEYSWYYWANVIESEIKQKQCIETLNNRPSITPGETKRQNDFPHLGAVGWKLPNGDLKFMCSCSLISPKFAVTAAHCRKGPKSIFQENNKPYLVRFGNADIRNSQYPRTRDVLISNFYVPEEYSPNARYNDIGLIKLEQELDIEPNIRPACLWTGGAGHGSVANVSGWDFRSADSQSKHLMYEEVNIIDAATCKRYLHGRNNRHWPQGLLDHQFCAGDQNLSGSCQVGTGPIGIRSPMPSGRPGVDHYILGVSNFGIGCGHPFLPSVYTNATSFLCWIEKTVWPEEQNDFCQ